MKFSENFHVQGEITTGPVLFGFLLDFFVFGILSVQTYMFYIAHPKDSHAVKTIVYGIFLFVVAQTSLAWHDFYALFCTPQGRLFTSDQNPYRKDLHLFYYTWFTIPASGAVVAFVAQCTYAFRIYRLTKSKLIPTTVICLTIVQLVFGLWGAAEMFRISYPHRAHRQYEHINMTSDLGFALARNLLWAPTNALCSLVIMIYLIYFITHMRCTDVRSNTQARIRRLIGLLTASGLVTALASLAYTFTAVFTTSAYMIFGVTLGKAYAFSAIVLVSCSRIVIIGGRYTPPHDTVVLPGSSARRTKTSLQCFNQCDCSEENGSSSSDRKPPYV